MEVWASLRERPRLRQTFATSCIISHWGCVLVIPFGIMGKGDG